MGQDNTQHNTHDVYYTHDVYWEYVSLVLRTVNNSSNYHVKKHIITSAANRRRNLGSKATLKQNVETPPDLKKF